MSLYLLLPMPARGSSPARYPGSTPSRGRRALPGTLKQRESGRERERGRGSRERAEETEREREREKVKNFQSERKNDVEGALDLSSSLNILKNPRPNPLVVLFCVTSSACFTMTIRSHSDAGTIAEIPHYGIR